MSYYLYSKFLEEHVLKDVSKELILAYNAHKPSNFVVFICDEDDNMRRVSNLEVFIANHQKT